jgi:hypothetical protein
VKLIDRIKSFFAGNTEKREKPNYISLVSMEEKFQNEDYMGAAYELKSLLERYGRRKRKNHRYKGREFIYFILSNKHKDLKNTGYSHWENLKNFIKLNQTKVYPYHKTNLRNAMDFFEKEIKGLREIKIIN